MKFWKLFWGFLFILAAVLLILDACGVINPLVGAMGEISIFAIIFGILLLVFIITRIAKGRFSSIFFPLAIIFVLFEKNIAKLAGLPKENIINNGLVFFIAILLTIGFSILFSPKKRRNHHGNSFGVTAHGAENSLGSSIVYIDCTDFTPSRVENNMGSCVVKFENIDSYKGDETLYIENNLGSMCIYIPSDWIIKSSIETNLAGTNIAKNDSQTGPVIYINGENNLGSLSIIRN